MLVSGFTYIRNGFQFQYPFLESIQSILPLCDEVVVAVGDSTDGTREAVAKLSEKIRIIDTVWDMGLREGGEIFAQQSNLALNQVKGDWAFHIQADELLHENDLTTIKKAIQQYNSQDQIEGLLFPYYHFFGSYRYIRTSRRVHRYEVRAFKTKNYVRSYKDSQGFRVYTDDNAYLAGRAGKKLNVALISPHIYHYNYVRPPSQMKEKADFFHRFWHNDQWLEEKVNPTEEFDYADADIIEEFTGMHPELMKKWVEAEHWDFDVNKASGYTKLKDKLLHFIEKNTGKRLFEYRNYHIIK